MKIKTTKIKTNDLIGAALDWAVTQAEGWKSVRNGAGGDQLQHLNPEGSARLLPAYSSDPAQSWPIIDREGIDLRQFKQRDYGVFDKRHFDPTKGDVLFLHKTSEGSIERVRRPTVHTASHGMWVARMSIDHTPFGWTTKDYLSPTSLIAAMRCYVGSRFGDEIEVPDELLEAA